MNINFNEICRFCLRICENYVDLNQTNGVKTVSDDVVEKIKYCYVLQIDLSEGLPSKICYECIQVLSFFYTAKKNILISEQLLRDVVFVRKKLQEETKNYKEMITPDLSQIVQNKEKIKSPVLPKKSILGKSDQSISTETNIELNCSNKCVRTTPVIDVETGETISEIDNSNIPSIMNMEGHGSRLKEKKLKLEVNRSSCIRKLPNNSYNDAYSLLKDFKKDQYHQQERKSRSEKDESVEMLPQNNTPSRENVKEIGKMNPSRIAPDVKRSRKVIQDSWMMLLCELYI